MIKNLVSWLCFLFSFFVTASDATHVKVNLHHGARLSKTDVTLGVKLDLQDKC